MVHPFNSCPSPRPKGRLCPSGTTSPVTLSENPRQVQTGGGLFFVSSNRPAGCPDAKPTHIAWTTARATVVPSAKTMGGCLFLFAALR